MAVALGTWLFLVGFVSSQQPDARFNWFSPSGSSLDRGEALASISSVSDMTEAIYFGVAIGAGGEIQSSTLVAQNGVYSRQRDTLRVIENLAKAIAPSCGPCGAHGTPMVSPDDGETCICICDEPVWTGETCNIHTCFNRGTWNGTACVSCTGDYDPSTYCSLRVKYPTLLPTTYDSCPAGVVGSCPQGNVELCPYEQREGCAYQCATESISMEYCPMRRNWSMDECVIIGANLSACFCGGGFSQFQQSALNINYLVCKGASASSQCHLLFNNTVCAPDVVPFVQCGTDDCCAELSDHTTCAQYGCLRGASRCFLTDSDGNSVRTYSYKTQCQYDTIGTLCLYRAIRERYLAYYKACMIGDVYCNNVRQSLKPNPAASINQWSITQPIKLSTATGYIDFVEGTLVYTQGTRPEIKVYGYDFDGTVVFLHPYNDLQVYCLCYQDYIGQLSWCDLTVFSDFSLRLSFTIPANLICLSDLSSFNIIVQPY